MAIEIKQPDLFGGESRLVMPSRSPYANFRLVRRYIRATGKANCSNCVHSCQLDYHDKTYRKCELMGDSRSPNTDVSRRMVCNAYKFKESAVTVA